MKINKYINAIKNDLLCNGITYMRFSLYLLIPLLLFLYFFQEYKSYVEPIIGLSLENSFNLLSANEQEFLGYIVAGSILGNVAFYSIFMFILFEFIVFCFFSHCEKKSKDFAKNDYT